MRLFLITALILLIPLQMAAIGGDSSAVTVSATILSKNKCKFNTKAATLDFGTLDPTNPVARNASATITFVCNGSAPLATFAITEDGGLNNYKMVHETDVSQTIPYALVLTPTSGSAPKGVDQTLTIGGSLLGADYQTALVGLYSDTVTVTLDP